MNWKSTAVVSGAGLLVTWFANAPGTAPVPPARAPRPAAVADTADIQHQAERLQVRVRQEIALSDSARNPFRFAPRAAATVAPAPAPDVQPDVATVPLPPSVRLSGIAIDSVDGRDDRTAILNTPSGLVFVHEGDEVAGEFQVKTISEDAVILIRTVDGSSLRLP
jgi:hypothetical protein